MDLGGLSAELEISDVNGIREFLDYVGKNRAGSQLDRASGRSLGFD